MKNWIRQGDILFVPCAQGEEAAKALQYAHKVEDGIVAQGEATGHAHRVACVEDAEVFATFGIDGRAVFVQVGENGVSVVHEEHKAVTLPPGSYTVHRAREFDYLQRMPRRVRD